MTDATDPVADELARLTAHVAALQAEVSALRAGGAALPPAEPAVDDVSYSWVSDVRLAPRRSLAPIRFLAEALFLVAAAVLAVVADLEAVEIAAVMAGAWVLVAVTELLASRAERRANELPAAPIIVRETVAAADPAWFTPPVERTLVQPAGSVDPDTAITRLPPVADVEATIESRRA